MKPIDTLRKFNTLKGLKKDIKLLNRYIWRISRKNIIKQYLSNNKIKKLHLGSNISLLDGWLCSDLVPATKKSIFLDVTQRFPFEDNTFDYIYSEHLIEHLSWQDGLEMLSESLRVLKNGGKIRIATPDLKIFIDLYSRKNDKIAEDYIHWITDSFVSDVDIYSPIFVINNIFRKWYHQFIYDDELLSSALNHVGFINIQKYECNMSDDVNLHNVEQHGTNVGNDEMVNYETLILEASKS